MLNRRRQMILESAGVCAVCHHRLAAAVAVCVSHRSAAEPDSLPR